MWQIAIVEDEAQAAATLKEYLLRYAKEYDQVFNIILFDNAVKFAGAKRDVDLIFMDIDMPGINGMEAAGLLRTYDQETPLIFVTNLAQYAVQGYEVDALDFIVKPVSYYHFSMRMDKALRVMRRNVHNQISVVTRAGAVAVPYADLIYVETVNHDLVYHLVNPSEEELRIRGSLSKLEEELSDGPFLRISSSCIVNLDHVRSIQAGELRMSSGEVLYASRAKKREVLETFTDYLGRSI